MKNIGKSQKSEVKVDLKWPILVIFESRWVISDNLSRSEGIIFVEFLRILVSKRISARFFSIITEWIARDSPGIIWGIPERVSGIRCWTIKGVKNYKHRSVFNV